MRDHDPNWSGDLHAQLGADWPLAMLLLIHVLGARFASKFADRDAIMKASSALANAVADEALAQRGLADGGHA